jgi:hypothetical protein
LFDQNMILVNFPERIADVSCPPDFCHSNPGSQLLALSRILRSLST